MATKNGFYKTVEKVAKAVPQPFLISTLALDVMKLMPDWNGSSNDMKKNIGAWASNRVRIGTLYVNKTTYPFKYSFDKADHNVKAIKDPMTDHPVLNGIPSRKFDNINVDFSYGVESMVVRVNGTLFEIKRVN